MVSEEPFFTRGDWIVMLIIIGGICAVGFWVIYTSSGKLGG